MAWRREVSGPRAPTRNAVRDGVRRPRSRSANAARPGGSRPRTSAVRAGSRRPRPLRAEAGQPGAEHARRSPTTNSQPTSARPDDHGVGAAVQEEADEQHEATPRTSRSGRAARRARCAAGGGGRGLRGAHAVGAPSASASSSRSSTTRSNSPSGGGSSSGPPDVAGPQPSAGAAAQVPDVRGDHHDLARLELEGLDGDRVRPRVRLEGARRPGRQREVPGQAAVQREAGQLGGVGVGEGDDELARRAAGRAPAAESGQGSKRCTTPDSSSSSSRVERREPGRGDGLADGHPAAARGAEPRAGGRR